MSFAPLAAVAAAGVLIAWFAGGDDGQLVFRTRLAGMFVAATIAGLLDDPAAPTLASSPTPPAARFSFRVAVIAVLVGGWWSAMLTITTVRTADFPAIALTRELVVLTALSIMGALAGRFPPVSSPRAGGWIHRPGMQQPAARRSRSLAVRAVDLCREPVPPFVVTAPS